MKTLGPRLTSALADTLGRHMGIFTDDMHTAAWNKGLATKTKDCNLYEWSVERYNSHSDLKNVEL